MYSTSGSKVQYNIFKSCIDPHACIADRKGPIDAFPIVFSMPVRCRALMNFVEARSALKWKKARCSSMPST